MKKEILRFILNRLPDCRFKRKAAGGTWVYYMTSLPMPPVWTQTDLLFPPRMSCEIERVRTEWHGAVKIELYPRKRWKGDWIKP